MSTVEPMEPIHVEITPAHLEAEIGRLANENSNLRLQMMSLIGTIRELQGETEEPEEEDDDG